MSDILAVSKSEIYLQVHFYFWSFLWKSWKCRFILNIYYLLTHYINGYFLNLNNAYYTKQGLSYGGAGERAGYSAARGVGGPNTWRRTAALSRRNRGRGLHVLLEDIHSFIATLPLPRPHPYVAILYVHPDILDRCCMPYTTDTALWTVVALI